MTTQELESGPQVTALRRKDLLGIDGVVVGFVHHFEAVGDHLVAANGARARPSPCR